MKFDVLDNPWIPVLYLDDTRKTVSLRTVLSEAHLIERLDTLNVMEEYGVYRFLILFMTCVHRPVALKQVIQICKAGKFDMKKVEEYIKLCQSEGVSFNIFDSERPFLQDAYSKEYDFPNEKDAPKKAKAITNIDASIPHGNNVPHFNQVWDKNATMEVDKAIRCLIASRIFCTAMGGGIYPSNVTGAPPLYYILNGKNLFETIAYSILVLDVDNRDLPSDKLELWRNTMPVEPEKVIYEISILQALLFPTRRILLVPPQDDGLIHHCFIKPGLNFKSIYLDDPFVIYQLPLQKKSKKKKNKETTDETADDVTETTEKAADEYNTYKTSLKPKVEKNLWRHIASVYASNLMDTRVGGKAGTLDILKAQYSILCEKLKHTTVVPLRLYGVATDQSSYLDMQYGEYTMDSRIVEHPILIDEVVARLDELEKIADSLNRACYGYIKSLSNFRKVPLSILNQEILSYYADAETEFLDYCNKLAECKENEHGLFNDEDLLALRAEFLDTLTILAKRGFKNFTSHIAHSAKQIYKTYEKQKAFYKRLENLKKVKERKTEESVDNIA